MKVRKILLVFLLISPVLTTYCTEPYSSRTYFEQLEEKLYTMQAAGVETPAVVYVDGLWAPQYISQGLLTPIPVERMDDFGDFYETLLPYFQRDENQLPCSDSSGACYTYALPHNVQTMGLVVNWDLFQEAAQYVDIDLKRVEEGEWNWDDFRAMAENLTTLGPDVYGVGLTPGFWNFLPFLFQADGLLLNESGTELILTQHRAEEAWPAFDALAFYTDLYREGLVFPPRDQWPVGQWPYWGQYDEMIDAFAEKRIAMLPTGPSVYDRILDRMGLDPATQETVKVIELPAGPARRATIGEVRGFGLVGEPSEAAVKFLNFATGPEGMSFWIGDQQSPPDYLPARRSLRGAWLETHPDTNAFAAGTEYMVSYQPAVAPIQAIAEFDQLAADYISGALLGEISVEEALEIIQAEGNAKLQEWAR
jgi:ABC-type glycerol-3-phosphate transport system substrate-binding protein